MPIQANQQEFNLNNSNSMHEPLHISKGLSIVSKTIEQLLAETFDKLRKKQLLKFTPNCAQNEFMTIFNIYLYQSTPNYGTLNPSGLQQDEVTKIIKIEKDNLSPKQLLRLDPQNLHAINDLPESLQYSIRARRSSNMTNRSLLKRRPSPNIRLMSGSTTERSNLQKKLTSITNDKQIAQVEKGPKSIAVKRDPLRNFTLLVRQQQQSEDQETIYLREKVIFNSKQRDRQQNEINQRIRLQKQKIINFNSKIGTKGNFTFEFNGQLLGSNELKDQKIKCYQMNVDLNQFSRNYRTMYKHLQQSSMIDKLSSSQQQQQQIVKNKTSRTRQSQLLNETINLVELTLNDIPKFTKDQSQRYGDSRQLRVEEYRKLYGRRFSRYNHPSFTIDVDNNGLQKGKTHMEDDLIMGKKHLTDSVGVRKKDRSSSVNKSYMATKLALPKLQGKYKMLDRYQQI